MASFHPIAEVGLIPAGHAAGARRRISSKTPCVRRENCSESWEMKSLYSVVYVSTASRPFSTADLKTLLARSRERNQQAGITGMLLYKSGCFLQAFEGGEQPVRVLHERISADPRHRNIVVLLNGPIAERAFSQWTMGFKQLTDADVETQLGFAEMLKMLIRHGRCSMDTSFAIKLLRSFTDQPSIEGKVV